MTRLVFVYVPLAAVLSAWAGAASDGRAIGWVLALLLGWAAAQLTWNVAGGRTRRLSRAVNAWMGKVEVDPVELEGGPDHRALATALNTLGAAYARRGVARDEAGAQPTELVAALPEPAVLFDAGGTVVAMNGPARELLGAGEATTGTSATQALGSAALADLVDEVLADPDAGRDSREVQLGRRTVSARATAYADHVLLLVRDLTEARRVAALRRDFVTNASHELKTPVAGIQSLADAIDVVLADDPDRARLLLSRLRGEADRMSTLVGDLLSLRRVDDAGDPTTEAVVVEVERIAADVLAGVAVAAEERGIEVELEVEGTPRVRVVADDLRLVLANLVDNAIKYNRDDGRVTIDVRAEGDRVRIDVRDTGIGIPSADHERVFERFYRVDPGRSREAGGTGLGLSIVRHAVERNGGEVEVDSLVGRGTTFTVRLPAA